MLLQLHGAKLLEAGRGILQRSEDRFAVADLQSDDPCFSVVGALKPFGRVDQFGIAERASELQDEPSRNRDASEVDGGQGAPLSSSIVVTGSAIQTSLTGGGVTEGYSPRTRFERDAGS